jgi:uncharacterized protein YbdZ (MbtH family)
MSWDEEEDTQTYKVVVNHEEQYTIWPADRDNSLGWKDVGKEGSKEECLDHIPEVWTDMLPLSLRKKTEEHAAPLAPEAPSPSVDDGGNDLVRKLAEGEHRVVFRARGDDPVGELKRCIDRDYVHVKFTETRGGTELGFRLDGERTDLSRADFANGKGRVHLAGRLTLDYVPVRCEAALDLESMEGTGHLVILEEEAAGARA